jgi:hypothetical protein
MADGSDSDGPFLACGEFLIYNSIDSGHTTNHHTHTPLSLSRTRASQVSRDLNLVLRCKFLEQNVFPARELLER